MCHIDGGILIFYLKLIKNIFSNSTMVFIIVKINFVYKRY